MHENICERGEDAAEGRSAKASFLMQRLLFRLKASVLMERLSYLTKTVLSNKMTRSRILLSLKDSPTKSLD